MKTINRVVSFIIAAVFLLSVASPLSGAFAESDTITINNEQDFLEFAKNCQSDTWSQGKKVVLTKDIDLSGKDFEPAATFGGSFDAKGYTVSGINMTSKGSYIGLFRYIQKGASVENLTVSANVSPDGSKKYVGIIAGENNGTIKNCKVLGNVSAKASVGGICGYITETGSVTGCVSSAFVTGESYTGGICGQNYGTVELCENQGKVNVNDNEEAKTIQDLDINIENLRSSENVDTNTDTGGICGFSKGKITDCKNFGDVGYKSVGYNTGGICGRQSGYISACENYGKVNGRKDIGGICGQAEPYVMLEYAKDALEQMNDIFDNMQAILKDYKLYGDSDMDASLDKINDAMGNITDESRVFSDKLESYGDDVQKSIDDVTTRLHNSLENSKEVFDTLAESTDNISKSVDSFKAVSDELKNITDDLKNVFDNMENAGDNMSQATAAMQKSVSKLSDACNSIADGLSSLEYGTKQLQKALNSLKQALATKKDIKDSFKDLWKSINEVKKSLNLINNSFEDVIKALEELKSQGKLKADAEAVLNNLRALVKCEKQIIQAIGDIGDACLILGEDFDLYSITYGFDMMSEGLSYLSDAAKSLSSVSEDLKRAVNSAKPINDKAKNAADKFSEGLGFLGDSMNKLTKSVNLISGIVDDATSGGKISIPSASDRLGGSFDKILDSTVDIRNECSNLKDILSGNKDKLYDKLDSLTDEMSKLETVLSDAYDEHIKTDEDDVAVDVSDEDYFSDTRGKIANSTNHAQVNGDLNVGGIVGQMAIEYDFDPEDDIKDSGEKSLSFTYKTKCVIRRCKNEGEVISKKNYSGGISGKMDLGSVISCENYGNILSDDGNYVGGISGMSETYIRNSVSKCTVSGTDYIGGIVGFGNDVSNCYALVFAKNYGECAGSIAGNTDDRDKLKSNYFVGDALGGIDNISYEKSAKQTDVDSFVKFVESNFGTDVQFYLTFTADGNEIAKVPFTYKEKIAEEKIPKVPEKKGFYGKWSEYNFDEATYDAVIEALYYKDIDIIESDEKRNGKSVVLICGAFDDNAAVSAVKNKEYADKLKNKKIYDSYRVKVEGVYNEKNIVRYLPQNSKKGVDIYVEENGSITKVKTKKFGSYLEFETAGNDFKIYEAKKSYALVIALCAAGVLLLAVIVMVIIKAKRKKLPIKKTSGKKEKEKETSVS